MEFKTRHLRVDVATKSKVHNNKCSVFLGALAFDVTDEAVYEHFAKCGEIDNVRIIRDNKTGVGKGFGYVQFKTADTIDLALKLDASKMGERKIRVSRAVKKLVSEFFYLYKEFNLHDFVRLFFDSEFVFIFLQYL